MKCIPIWVQKNYCWIWIAVDRHGKKFIDCVIGDRGSQTGNKLWEKVKSTCPQQSMTDHWKTYKKMLSNQAHVCSKAETYTVEGYNSLLRHFLARLRRKSKCYSKSIEALKYSVLLLMAKRNN